MEAFRCDRVTRHIANPGRLQAINFRGTDSHTVDGYAPLRVRSELVIEIPEELFFHLAFNTGCAQDLTTGPRSHVGQADRGDDFRCLARLVTERTDDPRVHLCGFFYDPALPFIRLACEPYLHLVKGMMADEPCESLLVNWWLWI